MGVAVKNNRMSAATSAEGSNGCRSWVVFAIAHERLDPERVTHELGIEPDRVYAAQRDFGEWRQWQINSRLSGEAPLEEHVWDIIKRLTPAYKRLVNHDQKYRMMFYCTIAREKGVDSIEPIKLAPRLLSLVAYIGATIEIDVK